MRTRSVCLSLFATLVLLPSPAAATPITVNYSGTYSDQAGISVSNTTYLSGPVLGFNPVVIDVPKFNPALGTLLSAQLTVTAGLAGVMLHHAELYLPGGVFSTARGAMSAGLIPNASLLNLLGGNPTMGVNFGTEFISDAGAFLEPPFAGTLRNLSDTYFFQQTYTGAGLQPFLATFAFDAFWLQQGGQSALSFSGSHSGFPDNDMLEFQQRTATAPNFSPTNPIGVGTIAALSVLALQIMNLEVEHGGLLGYSDFHMQGAAVFGMNVQYTYEPAVAAVPEPGTLALLGAGLLVVARSVRRSRRTASRVKVARRP